MAAVGTLRVRIRIVTRNALSCFVEGTGSADRGSGEGRTVEMKALDRQRGELERRRTAGSCLGVCHPGHGRIWLERCGGMMSQPKA